MNNVTLTGRAVRDPEIKFFDSGSTLAEVCIAVKAIGKDKPADFIDLKVWGKQAQVVADYIKKGKEFGITGQIKQEKWVDSSTGKNRSKLVVHVDRIELMGSRKDDESEEAQSFGGGPVSSEEVPF